MSVVDVIARVEAICKKYEKYDLEKQRKANQSSNDAFMLLYSDVQLHAQAAEQKVVEAAMEKNPAIMAALNADIRRLKASLLGEIPKLEKLASRKVKGVSSEDLANRPDLVIAVREMINDIGNDIQVDRYGKKAMHLSKKIEFESDEIEPHEDYWRETELSTAFRSEVEMRKIKQDQNLDIISEGLDTLKNLARDMGEELDRQQVLTDDIENKVDSSTEKLKQTNRRMKQTIKQLRSSRMFIIDIVLICLILGLGVYLFKYVNELS